MPSFRVGKSVDLLLGVFLTQVGVLENAGASESIIFHPDACRNLTVPVVEMSFRASAEIVALVEKNNSLTVAVDIGGSLLPRAQTDSRRWF